MEISHIVDLVLPKIIKCTGRIIPFSHLLTRRVHNVYAC